MASASTLSTVAPALSPYVVTPDVSVAALEASEAFKQLSAQEAKYALHMAQAAWAGAPVTMIQTSPESPLIHSMFLALFRQGVAPVRDAATAAGVSKADFDAFLSFVGTFMDNAGNYKR
jgi:dipeptidyl-peptidase-3